MSREAVVTKATPLNVVKPSLVNVSGYSGNSARLVPRKRHLLGE